MTLRTKGFISDWGRHGALFFLLQQADLHLSEINECVILHLSEIIDL